MVFDAFFIRWKKKIALGLLVFLALFLGNVALSAASDGYSENIKRHKDCQPRFMTYTDEQILKEYHMAKKEMENNHVIDWIRHYAPQYEKELLAIAYHESGGLLHKKNGEFAFCTFQIYYTNMPSWKTYVNESGESYPDIKNGDDFKQKILQDPRLCTATGAYILKTFLRNGYDIGVCQYGGQGPPKGQSFVGSCCLLEELKRIISVVDGHPYTPVIVTDPTSPHYADVKTKDSRGQTIYIPNCLGDVSAADGKTQHDLVQGLLKGATAYQNAVLIATGEVFVDTFESQRKDPILKGKGELDKKYCISFKIGSFLEFIRDFLTNFKSAIKTLIMKYIKELVNYVCEYAAEAINAALSSICLPIPDLSLSLDMNLGGFETKSCDGLSLKSFISAQSGSPSIGGGSGSTPKDELTPIDVTVTNAGGLTGGVYLNKVLRRVPAGASYKF